MCKLFRFLREVYLQVRESRAVHIDLDEETELFT